MNWREFPNLARQGQLEFLTTKDGTRLRVASWPSSDSSRGIVVLVSGHREYIEKYSEFISDFLDRGFALYTLDNRGQGLSDRLLSNRVKSYAENFQYFSSDLNEFITSKVMADPRAQSLPIYLIGHSMGGHICLRYLHDFPGVIDKAVLLAPMIDFKLGGSILKKVTKLIIRLACRMGFQKKYAFGQGSVFSKEHHLIKQKLLTHDGERYAVEAEIIEARPELYVGGATFGWLGAALDSMEKIRQSGFLDKITIPLLVALAGDDRLVDNQVGREMLSGHDNINIVTIHGSRHEIYRESNQYRDQLWQEIDKFLGVE